MKYIININQASIYDHGLADKTDLTDWAIIDYIKDWQANPKAERHDQMIWFNYGHAIKQMPLINIKTKGPLSKRIKKLFYLNLIDVHKEADNRLFVELTSFAIDVISFRGSKDKQRFPKETGVSQKKQGVSQKKQGVSQKKQGVSQKKQGVSQKKHSIEHHLSVHQDKKREGEATKQAEPAKSTPTWNAYSRAYLNRYRVSPLRGAKVNKLLCQFVDQVGAGDAPAVAAYYLNLNEQWYQKKGHDVATLLQNAQSIYTQWATGTNKTSGDYKTGERRSKMAQTIQNIKDKRNRGEQ